MLDFIKSFKECRLIILGKYHYFSELLDSIENATPEETNDFWKIIAPIHHRMDTDKFNIEGSAKRHQSFKMYVAYFKVFYEKNLKQIDQFLTINPNATSLDEQTCKIIFQFYISLSLYADMGKFMVNKAYHDGLQQMKSSDAARRKSHTKVLGYNNADKSSFLNEVNLLMSQEGSLDKICAELMKILIASNTVDSHFEKQLSYHATFATQLGHSAPITKLHYSPKSVLNKIEKHISEINSLFLQYLKTLPPSQIHNLNLKRTKLITDFNQTKIRTLTLSKEPLWIKVDKTIFDILENYQSLMNTLKELSYLKPELLSAIHSVTEIMPSQAVSQAPPDIEDSLPITSVVQEETFTAEVISTSEPAEPTLISFSSSSSSSSSSPNCATQHDETNECLSLDSCDELSQELKELNLELTWDFERSRIKKRDKIKSGTSSSSSSHSRVEHDDPLQRIAARLDRYKDEFKQLFTHDIHMVFTEKLLQKMITLVGGSIIEAEGSRKRIIIDQTASDTLSESKMVVHLQHGPKARSRSKLPSFIVKNYRCVLQNAGLTPEKLWPLEYSIKQSSTSSLRLR